MKITFDKWSELVDFMKRVEMSDDITLVIYQECIDQKIKYIIETEL